MVTKSNIYNWVEKCRQKALNSIMTAHEAELEQMAERNPKLKAIVDSVNAAKVATEGLQK